jgi:hypothetical protein
MEGNEGLALSSNIEQSEIMSVADWLDSLCPYYMALGVSLDEYWHGDPTNLHYYVEAQEFKNEQKNQEMWTQGLYNYQAFQSVIGEFGWGLGGKKGAKPEPYRSYPLAVTEREKEAEKQRSIAKTLAWVQKGQVENPE